MNEAPVSEPGLHGRYEACSRPGKSNSLIICFAGLGAPTTAAAFEWVSSTASYLAEFHAIFVRDLSKSWYAADGWPQLIEMIDAYRAEHRITRVVALGASMGASGAMELAMRSSVDRVLALAPQIDISETSIDPRYQDYWARIDRPHRNQFVQRSISLAKRTECWCLFSIDDFFDTRHAEQLSGSDWKLAPYRSNHNIASKLKRQDKLSEWLRAAVANPIRITHSEEHLDVEHLFSVGSALTRGDVERLAHIAECYFDNNIERDAPIWLSQWLRQAGFERELASSFSAGRVVQMWPTLLTTEFVISGSGLLPFLEHGWSESDDGTGVWSVGTYHTIRARVLDFPPVGQASLHIAIEGFAFDGRSQTMNIYESGVLISQHLFTECSPVDTFIIPLKTDVIDITVVTPDAASPAALNCGSDNRRLGVRVLYFWVASSPPER